MSAEQHYKTVTPKKLPIDNCSSLFVTPSFVTPNYVSTSVSSNSHAMFTPIISDRVSSNLCNQSNCVVSSHVTNNVVTPCTTRTFVTPKCTNNRVNVTFSEQVECIPNSDDSLTRVTHINTHPNSFSPTVFDTTVNVIPTILCATSNRQRFTNYQMQVQWT